MRCWWLTLPLVASALLTACGADGASNSPSIEAPAPAARLARIVMYKSPTCACCGRWAEHLHAHGFVVDTVATTDMAGVKERLGVPNELASCHTGEVDGYVLEGHIPASAVERLLRERPSARGLTVPGMPPGSPGMEVPGPGQPYDVLLLQLDGTTEVFEHVSG